MKALIKCTKCGKLLGLYAGDPFFLMPATDLKVLCEDCSRLFKRQCRNPDHYQQVNIKAFSKGLEEVNT